MDEFTVEIPGVKPVKMQAYFTSAYINYGQRLRKTSPAMAQLTTTCVIRRNGLILGTGVAVCSHNDTGSRETGEREALKKAAKVAGWAYVCKFMSVADREKYNPNIAAWKYIFSAWRKSRRAEALAEEAANDEANNQ